MLPTTLDGWRTLTTSFIVTWAVLAVAYTLSARLLGGTEATISATLQDAARRWPEVPFFLGLLCGHIFWTVR